MLLSPHGKFRMLMCRNREWWGHEDSPPDSLHPQARWEVACENPRWNEDDLVSLNRRVITIDGQDDSVYDARALDVKVAMRGRDGGQCRCPSHFHVPRVNWNALEMLEDDVPCVVNRSEFLTFVTTVPRALKCLQIWTATDVVATCYAASIGHVATPHYTAPVILSTAFLQDSRARVHTAVHTHASNELALERAAESCPDLADLAFVTVLDSLASVAEMVVHVF